MSGFTLNPLDGSYSAETDFYGIDILFDGKLHVGPSGDFVTVDGFENLRRALMRRLMVVPGSYRLRPDYGAGLGSYVKKQFTSTLKAELTKRVRAQILRDRRVSRILELTVTQGTVNGEPVITVFLRAEALGRRFEPRPFNIPRGT